MFPPHRIAHGVVEPAEHVAANRHGKTYIRELETDLAPVLRPFVLGRQKSASGSCSRPMWYRDHGALSRDRSLL